MNTPGVLQTIFMLLPVSAVFFYWLLRHDIATSVDWAAGVALGVFLSVALFRVIERMKDPATGHAFKA